SSRRRHTRFSRDWSSDVCSSDLGSAQGQALVQGYRLGTSQYFADYPEDIQLYGLSFSTILPTGTTLSGELSYRPNMPIQISAVRSEERRVGKECRSRWRPADGRE